MQYRWLSSDRQNLVIAVGVPENLPRRHRLLSAKCRSEFDQCVKGQAKPDQALCWMFDGAL